MWHIAPDMGQKGPENPLQSEEVYFDGSHLQWICYKTLALFVYHPAMQCILRTATIEVKSKSTWEISFFWKLLNKVLSKIMNREYILNPKAIRVDKNGANYCAIKEVFGVDCMAFKVIRCQMH